MNFENESIGGGCTWTLDAEHVRQAPPHHSQRRGDALRHASGGRGRNRISYLAQIDEVCARPPEALELLLNQGCSADRGFPAAIEVLRQKNVLRQRHGVLQEPVDKDDVDSDERLASPDRLR